MTRTALGLACGFCVGTASAQTELEFCIQWISPGQFLLVAELMNPTGTILATIADLEFRIRGENIRNVNYNPAFDSDFFGPADLTVTRDLLEFRGGNYLPPLNNAGGPDSTNPLHIMSFEADIIYEDTFEVIGQLSGAYVGTPFPDIFFYQLADGSPGTVPWTYCVIPAPGCAPVLACAVLGLARRKRG